MKLSEYIKNLQRLQKRLEVDPDVYIKNPKNTGVRPALFGPYLNTIFNESKNLQTVVIVE